jgi:hypothetical protein
LLFGGDFHRWKIVAVSDHQSLGKNFAETQCMPKSFAKIVQHEPMDIPTSSATSQRVNRRFPWIMSFTLAIRGLDLEVEGWPDHLLASIKVLPFFKMFEPFIGRHLTQGIIAVSFTHVVGFCSGFPYFDTEFYTNSLLPYQLHTQHDKTTTHSITKPVIKTKRNVPSTWNKMACVTNGQVARSLKQHLT